MATRQKATPTNPATVARGNGAQPQQQIDINAMSLEELYELLIAQMAEAQRIQNNIGALRAVIDKKKTEKPQPERV